MKTTNFMRMLGMMSLFSMPLYSFTPAVLFKPDDPFFRIPLYTKDLVAFHGEFGQTSQGFGAGGGKRNVLAIDEDVQLLVPALRTLSNLQLFPFGLSTAIPTRQTDGYIQFSGKLKDQDVTFWGKLGCTFHKVPGRFSCQLFLPVKTRRMENIAFTDLTSNLFPESRALQAFIKNLQTNLQTLGGLSLNDTTNTGLGDITALFEWDVRLKQEQDMVNFVTLYLKAGLLIPSGAGSNINNPFSLALGNDGAWGFPVGVGVETEFVRYARAGITADFLPLLDDKRLRRLKVAANQTDFLLLTKGQATKRYGITWQLEFFLQAYKVWRGFSAEARYQFLKHQGDRLISNDPNFSNVIINTSASLKDWYLHTMTFNLSYDFSKEFEAMCIMPHLSFFVRVPLAGKSAPNMITLGGQLGICF